VRKCASLSLFLQKYPSSPARPWSSDFVPNRQHITKYLSVCTSLPFANFWLYYLFQLLIRFRQCYAFNFQACVDIKRKYKRNKESTIEYRTISHSASLFHPLCLSFRRLTTDLSEYMISVHACLSTARGV
jgi:hypothetical protein